MMRMNAKKHQQLTSMKEKNEGEKKDKAFGNKEYAVTELAAYSANIDRRNHGVYQYKDICLAVRLLK